MSDWSAEEGQDSMQFYFFHLMPWPHLPADYDDREKYPSSWVTLSNTVCRCATILCAWPKRWP
jgi:hypothetical protein